ncbi:MAG: hypothetical protein AAFO07_14825 [Bacteroidota bacterium]
MNKKDYALYAIFIGMLVLSLLWPSSIRVDVKEDYIEIIKLIRDNPDYFQNNSIRPCLFFRGSLNNNKYYNDFEHKDQLVDLLEKHGIDKLYVSSKNEIWLLLKENRSFMVMKNEKLLGFVEEENLDSLKINNYEHTPLKKIQGKWYSTKIRYSLVD